MVWPELDQLLRNEDDKSNPTTPYTAAVPEYRIVFMEPSNVPHLDKMMNLSNGRAVHDMHNPCRYIRRKNCELQLLNNFLHYYTIIIYITII